MDKNLTIKERILTYIEEKGITKSNFFSDTGIASSNFKGKNLTSQLGGDAIVKILTTYPDVNPNWLMLGKGSMLLTDISVPSEAPATKATSPSEGIPLIPFSAMAGALAGEQTALDYECERYVVPAFKNADFLMRVQGVSMQPTYLSGDIVACQRVPLSDIFFQWNKTYVLDTSQGALIKRVKPGKDDHHILIVSDNTQYDPFELSCASIHAIALVIGLIRLE